MLIQLAIATAMVLATVIMHGLGLLGLTRVLRAERNEERLANLSPFSLRGLAATIGVVLALFALHGTEIWLYALVYLQIGALQGLEEAVYFSTITYGTVGYDDDGFHPAWQLVAAVEGINGVLLLGWSTAFFISLAARLRLH
ncbi:ion channel [Alteraurantiacibacter buctensis]|uniref:Two pore domain potassium channel family protein n=1 Tax=Alteraurantiacibacter buctensis TaxID=1503981 RepID=A0A844Z2A6_9SPHN|nr:ion channel [Alteraurantiacibacter buctensis]MXO73121.1 two pore domain potassium channel family protein [Alteraurantiacibacter buctensis]